jgi:hypothetical protein
MGRRMSFGNQNAIGSSFNRNEEKYHLATRNISFLCPGCLVTTKGLRPFSEHKYECGKFDRWKNAYLDKNPFLRAKADKPVRPDPDVVEFLNETVDLITTK